MACAPAIHLPADRPALPGGFAAAGLRGRVRPWTMPGRRRQPNLRAARPALSLRARLAPSTGCPLAKTVDDETQAAREAAEIRSIASGDQSAFARLIDRESPRLLRFARTILGTLEEAEDVVQETLITPVGERRALAAGGARRHLAAHGLLQSLHRPAAPPPQVRRRQRARPHRRRERAAGRRRPAKRDRALRPRGAGAAAAPAALGRAALPLPGYAAEGGRPRHGRQRARLRIAARPRPAADADLAFRRRRRP